MSNILVANPFYQPAESGEPTSSSGTEIASVREAQEVQAMVAVAKRFPRDPVQAMDRILQACTRPGLAEESQYQYTQGGSDINGVSIHLAKAMVQLWGNTLFGSIEVNRSKVDGVGVSDVKTYAWDLETNVKQEISFKVKHWRDTKTGGYPIKEERDINSHIANQSSRRLRTCLLSIIPGDVTEAARRQCDLTLKSHADTSPEAIKKLLEAFSQFGVTRQQIEGRIQRRLDSITPALMIQMRKIFTSLKDGMSGVSDWFPPVGQEEAKGTVSLKERMRGKKETETKVIPESKDVEEDQDYIPPLEGDEFNGTPPTGWAELMTSIASAQNGITLKTLHIQAKQFEDPWRMFADRLIKKQEGAIA